MTALRRCALFAALFAAGCAGDTQLKDDTAADERESSADIAGDAATSDDALYLEVRPLDGEQPAVQLGPLSPAAIDGGELVVPSARTVSGQVLLGDGSRAAEAARVRFVALDGIPGRQTLLEAVTGTVATGAPGRFAIDLPPGRYDVTATPAAVDGFGGPTELLRPNLSLEALAAGPLSLTLTAPEKLLALDGLVQLNRVGTATASPGITVRAVFEEPPGPPSPSANDADEGDDDTSDDDVDDDDASDDGTSDDDEDVVDADVDTIDADDVVRLLTHPAAARPVVTDAEGRYRLLVAPLPEWAPPRRIRLLYGPGGDEQPGVLVGPVYRLSGATLTLLNDPAASSDEPASKATTTDTGTDASLSGQTSSAGNAVPLPKARRVAGTVEEVDRFGVARPAAGALVSLRAREGEPLFDHRTVVTDTSGRWEAWLLPVAYDIVALPQAGAERPTDLCRAESADAPYVLRCAPPIRLAGTVVGLPVGAATSTETSTETSVAIDTVSTVELVRRPDSAWEAPWRLTLSTAADGTFVADLPSGLYELRATPPQLTGAPARPAALVDGVVVPPASQGAVAPITVILPSVRPLSCRLVRTAGDAGFTASVEAYRLGPDGTPRLVGRGVSQRDGSLSMSLSPASP